MEIETTLICVCKYCNLEVYRIKRFYKNNCDILRNKNTPYGTAVITCIAKNVNDGHRQVCLYYPVTEDPDEEPTY